LVHIADVTHFVREDGELDREARKRGTSIYLVDQVIPMLPAELSNGLCSLHPGEDKLTLTCEMEINLQGKVTHALVYESVILSDYRLTYREIDVMISQDIKL
jgi:ribonuclease R